MDGSISLPELGEPQYCTEVMHLPVDKTEVQHDREMVYKAQEIGIATTLPIIIEAERFSLRAMSVSTNSTSREQTFSTISDGSPSSYMTPRSSIYGVSSPGSTTGDSGKILNFAPYEKYLNQVDSFAEGQNFRKTSMSVESSAQSIFSVSTKKSLSGVTSNFRSRMRLKKKPNRIMEIPLSCMSCHVSFTQSHAVRNLPCGHAMCTECLKNLTSEAVVDEARMPPACCGLAVSSEVLQEALNVDEQESFLKAVVQFGTPFEARLFCTNAECGEFIPSRKRVDPHMPFAVSCLKCQTKVCSTCKGGAHDLGTHCPEDWELLDAVKIGGQGSWRRCYRCRKLVEILDTNGAITCVCNAQFCHSCGGVWDIATGCPNVCAGQEALERRRKEEAQRVAESEAESEAKQLECEERSKFNPSMLSLKSKHEQDQQRFLVFMAAAESSMKARHSAQRVSLMNRQAEEEEKQGEKHSKATGQLEDSQIAEEMDLRASLEQASRSIKVRIKHMEAYCEGVGRSPAGSQQPPRVVTEQNLRDLGRQYTVRDDMERQHESKINMMRDRQSKRMEELLQRHGQEMDKLYEKQQREKDDLDAKLESEEQTFRRVFEARQSHFTDRWNLAIEMQCKELEGHHGQRYGPISAPSWGEEGEKPVLEAPSA